MPPTELAGRLAQHVQRLAADIGERNVWHPAAMQAAADYIRHEWAAQGYTVREQSYDVGGLRCANLEVAVPGDDGGPMIVMSLPSASCAPYTIAPARPSVFAAS